MRGGKEGLCHHSHLGEVSSVTALGNQRLEASTDRTGLCLQAPAGSHLAAGHCEVAAGPVASAALWGCWGVGHPCGGEQSMGRRSSMSNPVCSIALQAQVTESV